jgi:hypothetical protein
MAMLNIDSFDFGPFDLSDDVDQDESFADSSIFESSDVVSELSELSTSDLNVNSVTHTHG